MIYRANEIIHLLLKDCTNTASIRLHQLKLVTKELLNEGIAHIPHYCTQSNNTVTHLTITEFSNNI